MNGPQENLHVALAMALGRPTSASNKTLIGDVEQLVRDQRGGPAPRSAAPTAPVLFDLEEAS